ncbi:hypothetical protein [Pseudomonas sp. RL_105y_Pfl1_103]|uniref:hypothetical protein n=1 Tax=Pseudomonas sp. RL_105y_Pfl1_103 TaxID=3088707 RepID=UPI0030DA3EA5
MIKTSDIVKGLSLYPTDLIGEYNGLTTLDFLIELVGDATFVYHYLVDSHAAVMHAADNGCKFSAIVDRNIERYLRVIDDFDREYTQRIYTYRESASSGTNLILLHSPFIPPGYQANRIASSLHIYDVLGNLTSSDDVREFLFGLGVQHDIDLFADRRSLSGVGERLVERLLEIRCIFLQALRQINEQCPIYGEDIVRIPLGYFKAQIEAVDKREASLVPVCECALPTLRLVT